MDRSCVDMRMLLLPVVVIAAMLVWLGRAFLREQRANRERLRGKSRVIKTRCGPIEYVDIGAGPAVLVVHGAGGGFDQGLEFAEPIAKGGYRVVAMSRFGYLQTPMPVDASPAAQADAHVALLDALDIDRTAVLGASAGAPSAMQFALRHADRCLALGILVPMAFRQQPNLWWFLLFHPLLSGCFYSLSAPSSSSGWHASWRAGC